jgi:hypothetical protein
MCFSTHYILRDFHKKKGKIWYRYGHAQQRLGQEFRMQRREELIINETN